MFVVPMAIAVAALLAAEYRGSRAGIWFAKPAASTVFVAAALRHGALGSGYGRLVLAALALSWLGDVLLIPAERPRVFRAGIAAFGLAHVAYVAAFLSRGFEPRFGLATAVVAVLLYSLVAPGLLPRVPREMRLPVRAYTAILSAMLVAGAGARSGDWRIFAGAALFYLSDLAVARDRFLAPGFVNGLVGLPLYYAAQMLLAATVAAAN